MERIRNMYQNLTGQKNNRIFIGYILLVLMLVILVVANICTGSTNIGIKDLLDVFGSPEQTKTALIIYQIRIPRALAALLLGGALALSGYMLQVFFGNPIAGPFVLGISSGAKLVVALTFVLCLDRGYAINSFATVIAAFAGSLISMAFVLIISSRVKQMSILIICGVMIGYICSSVTELVVNFADDSNIVNLHYWSMGSFSGIDNGDVCVIAVLILIALAAAISMVKPIGAYLMGETYASNMGVNIRLFRIALIILSSLLAACVTAFAGPVSFVGIAVPHLMKNLFKSSKPLYMIPACFLGGAVFCLLCDLIARNLFAPTELSISTITAIFGAPVVILMLIKRKGRA